MAIETPAQFAAAFGMVPATPNPIPPTQAIIHTTSQGERWDNLAWTYYGDATLISPIIMANPDVPIMSAFDEGIEISIPILQMNQVATEDVPPWSEQV